MRQLTTKEFVICVAGGALAGFWCRPRYARIPPAFLPDDEVVPAVISTIAGAGAVLGVSALLVWRKGW